MKGFDYSFDHQAMPDFFIQGPSPLARFVFFSALSLTLIATDSKLQYLKVLRQQLEAYIHPLQLMVNAPTAIYQDIHQYLSLHDELLNENAALKNKLIKKSADLQSLNLLKVENDHLRRILNVSKTLNQQSILGEILHASSDQYNKKVVLNRGQSQNVEIGAAVVDANGVIGQVTRLYSQTSVVTLITDKTMEVPVMVARNGLRAILFGKGQDNKLEITFLPTNVDIQVGDELVTSGIDGVYPPGMMVAKVDAISASTGAAFSNISCKPIGGVDFHRQILIVNPIKQAFQTITDDQVGDESTSSKDQGAEDQQAKSVRKEAFSNVATGKFKPVQAIASEVKKVSDASE